MSMSDSASAPESAPKSAPGGSRALRLLRTRPGFRMLWLASVVSALGDWLGTVALARLTASGEHAALALGLLFAAHTLPHALSAPIAGRLADVWPRRRVMLLAQVASALLTAGMLLVIRVDMLAAIPALVFVRGIATGLFLPAANAASASLVKPDELELASWLQSLSWSVMFSVGMALGGVAVSVLGPEGALGLDAASFVVAGLFVATLGPLLPREDARADGPSSDGSSANGPREDAPGEPAAAPDTRWLPLWQHMRSAREAWLAVWAKTPLALVGGAGWVALNLWAERRLRLPGLSSLDAAMAYGLFQAVRGVGTAIGPRLWLSHGMRGLSRIDWALFATTAALGVWVAMSAGPFGAVFVLALLLWGAFVGANWVISQAAIARTVPARMHGRAFAADGLALTLSQGLAAVLAGGLVHMGVPAGYVLAGVTAAAAVLWLVLRR